MAPTVTAATKAATAQSAAQAAAAISTAKPAAQPATTAGEFLVRPVGQCDPVQRPV